MPKRLAEPEKELRFTRAGQATHFWTLALLLICTAAGLLLLGTPWIHEWPDPFLPSPFFSLIPLPFAALAAWWAIHLTRHAYILLTPVGLEIFPFFRPTKNFRVVLWQEIEHLELTPDERAVIVSLVGGGKIFLATAPVAKPQRPLLKAAVEGAMLKRQGGDATSPVLKDAP